MNQRARSSQSSFSTFPTFNRRFRSARKTSRPKRGRKAPMEVMDTPFRAGDLRHGYQAVADNLPNDPRIHEEKGSKRIFFKNFMDARVNYVVLPIAKLLMREDQARMASMDGYLSMVVMHEISHGIGPAFARTSTGRVDIREAIGPIYSALEEAKADIVGMFALDWLMNQRRAAEVPRKRLLRFVRRRDFPNGSVRCCRSSRTRGDDGIQLSDRAGCDYARCFREVCDRFCEDARAQSPHLPKSCSRSKRPVTAAARSVVCEV